MLENNPHVSEPPTWPFSGLLTQTLLILSSDKFVAGNLTCSALIHEIVIINSLIISITSHFNHFYMMISSASFEMMSLDVFYNRKSPFF